MNEEQIFERKDKIKTACIIFGEFSNNLEKYDEFASTTVDEVWVRAVEKTNWLFAQFPKNDDVETVERKNTYQPAAKTADQYQGNDASDSSEIERETNPPDHFTGKDGVERYKTVCKTCKAVSWTKERAYTHCYTHRSKNNK